MEFTVKIDDRKVKKFIKDIMGNLPEYSLSLSCVGWKYEECKYIFVDNEDEKKYTITMDELFIGFKILANCVLNGAYSFDGLGDILELDGCKWDAVVVDALIQCSIFGEIIYG